MIPIALAVSVVLELGLSAVMIGLGLWLGPAVGMGRIADSRRFGRCTQRATTWMEFGREAAADRHRAGLGHRSFPLECPGRRRQDKPFTLPNAWEGLLASIGPVSARRSG